MIELQGFNEFHELSTEICSSEVQLSPGTEQEGARSLFGADVAQSENSTTPLKLHFGLLPRRWY